LLKRCDFRFDVAERSLSISDTVFRFGGELVKVEVIVDGNAKLSRYCIASAALALLI
jgi:hypothetical protein